ncbi:hypothetical protein [Cupriavidus necator]|uniref:hypothetical protein n=1 Tax=Cupriavidus necator TaxID=106590 RepID=UPI00339D6F06
MNPYALSLARNVVVLSRKSWVAYLPGALLAMLGCAVALVVGQCHWLAGWAVAWVVVLAAFAAALHLGSLVLCADDLGVWLCRGMLPWDWDIAVTGVSWQDFGRAEFQARFPDWLQNAHTIRIVNRHVSSGSMSLTHMRNSRAVVIRLNELKAERT